MYATRRDLQTVLRLFKGISDGDIGRHQALRIIDKIDRALDTEEIISAEEHDGFFLVTIEPGDETQQSLELDEATLADLLEDATAGIKNAP